MKLPVKVIKRDQYGIDLKELERIFKYEKIKFFYIFFDKILWYNKKDKY